MSKSRHVSYPLAGQPGYRSLETQTGAGRMPCPVGEGPYMEAFPPRQWLFSRISAESSKQATDNRPRRSAAWRRAVRTKSAWPRRHAPRNSRRPELLKSPSPKPVQAAAPPDGPSFLDFQRDPGDALPVHPRWEAGASVQGSLQRIFEAFPWVPAAEAARPVGVSAISSSAADSSIGLSRYFHEKRGNPSLSAA